MKLYKVELSKENLLSIPEEERIFFIQITNLANEIYVLQKITFFSAKDEEENDVVRGAQNSQAFFLIRLTAGKLWEGWRLLETHFFGTGLSKDYEEKFTDEGKGNLKFLKDYFKSKNLIKLIRDQYAFHYSKESSKNILDLIEKSSDTNIFKLFMSKYHGNCFYDISSTLAITSLINVIDEFDYGKGMLTLLTEINNVAENLLHFIGECVLVIAKRYIGFAHGEIEIPDHPRMDEVKIPYFVEKPIGYD